MPGTTQLLVTKASSVPAAATRQGGWPAVLVQFLSTSDSVVIWAAAGSFANFAVVLDVAPGAGTSRIFTFTNITTSATVVVTVADAATTNRDTGSTLAVSAGDLLQCVHTVTGAPAALGSCQLLSEFTGTTTGQTSYTMHHVPGNGGLSSGSGTEYVAGPFCGTTFNTTTPPNAPNVIAVDGTITAFYARCGSAPGAGKSWDFYLVKNGTLQDGTGGTVDTKCSVSGTGTPATAGVTISLAVVQGDTLSVQLVPTGSPATMRPGCAVCLTSTVPGESMVVGRLTTGPSNSATNYGFPVYATGGWNATETDAQEQAPLSTFTLDQLQVALQTAPGASKSRQFTVRVDSATPAGSPTATVSGTATTAAGSGSVVISDTTQLALQTVPSGTPSSSTTITWSLRARLGAYLTTTVSQPPMWPLPSVGRRNPAGWIFSQPLDTQPGNPIIPPVWPAPARTRPSAQTWIQTINLADVVVITTPFVNTLWALPQVPHRVPVGWIRTQPLTDAAVTARPPGVNWTPLPPPPGRAQLLSVMSNRLDVLAPPPTPPNCEMPLPADSGGGTGEP